MARSYSLIDGVNFSTLKHVETSLLRYKYAVEHRSESTEAQVFGDALHAAILEPHRLLDRFVCFRGDRRTKEWSAFQDDNSNKGILRPEQWDACLTLRDRVRNHQCVAPLIASGASEVTIEWDDPETKLHCKGRLDWAGPSSLLDLKSSDVITAREFGIKAHRYHYHVQAAWYRWGYQIATGKLLPFAFVVFEKDEPFDVAVYEMTKDAIALGEETFRLWLNQVADAKKRNEWPGLQKMPQDLMLPAWAYGRGEEQLLTFGGEALVL